MKNRLKAALWKPRMGRRLFMVLFAQLIMGLAVAMLRLTVLGTDPFSAMMLALTAKTPLSYGSFCALGNIAFFLVEIWGGRRYIGFGTAANWFLLGYAVMLWGWIFGRFGVETLSGLPLRLTVCVIAIVILAFSLSLYQSADIGSSPYDSMPLVLRDKLHMPFFAARILMDGLSVIVCFLADGVLGVGTLMIVAGLGPITAWFNTHFSEKLVSDKTE